jgi:hypothetical protein
MGCIKFELKKLNLSEQYISVSTYSTIHNYIFLLTI